MERNIGADSGIQKSEMPALSEEREKSRVETNAETVNRLAAWYNDARKTLEQGVRDLRQTIQAQGDRVEQLAKENVTLKNEVELLRQTVAGLISLRQTVEELTSLRPIADALKAAKEEREKEERLNARIAELEEEKRRSEKENNKQRNEIEDLKRDIQQHEAVDREQSEKIRALEEEKNADPHKTTRGDAYAIVDVKEDCKGCQETIYDEIRDLFNQASNDLFNQASNDKKTAVLQIAAKYLSELFDAEFCDYRDDVPSPSLAKRLRMSDEAARALEEKIKSQIRKIKEICARWRRENPNVELCKFYWPSKDDLLKSREAERTCEAFGLERLQPISSPSEESRVLLTLIPGIYSKTKGSPANLAPAYVVVAQVEESRPSAVAPSTTNAAKAEKASTTANDASPVVNARE